LKKREIVTYYMLASLFEDCTNIGELLDVLKPIMGGKRLASSMIRRLVRMRLLEKCGPMSYRPIGIDSYLTSVTIPYVLSRLKRRGLVHDYTVDVTARKVLVHAFSCDFMKHLRRFLVLKGWRIECDKTES